MSDGPAEIRTSDLGNAAAVAVVVVGIVVAALLLYYLIDVLILLFLGVVVAAALKPCSRAVTLTVRSSLSVFDGM